MAARGLAFVWDNFGPAHADRCAEVAAAQQTTRVVGIELSEKSVTYDWAPETSSTFEKITLSSSCPFGELKLATQVRILLGTCLSLGKSTSFFFCHYDKPAVFVTALALRILGHRVFTMNDSKFDDYTRHLPRELLKCLLYSPYQGAIAAGTRSADYLRFLGLPKDRIFLGYDTLSTRRLLVNGGGRAAPEGVPYSDRHFTIIARLVPKKNISLAITAYSIYVRECPHPRQLIICGSGPLEQSLREQIAQLGLTEFVHLRGFIQSDQISKTLASSIALILPSTEEQFGFAILEALCLGVPVLTSENCGARDELVRTGVNGFVIEPDNAEGFARAMADITNDEPSWRRMCVAALRASEAGDCKRFAEAVQQLTG